MTLPECLTLAEIFATTIFSVKVMHDCTVEHDFNGHVINGIHEVNGKKCYYRAFHFINKFNYKNFCTLIFLQFHPYREHAVQRVGAFL